MTMYNRILSVTSLWYVYNTKLNLNNGNYTVNFLTHQAHFSENRPQVYELLSLIFQQELTNCTSIVINS